MILIKQDHIFGTQFVINISTNITFIVLIAMARWGQIYSDYISD